MGKIANNANFFKERLESVAGPETKQEASAAEKQETAVDTKSVQAEVLPEIAPLEFSPALVSKVRKTSRLLLELGQKGLAQSVEQAYRDASSELFSVAVVGEFSRGKSTFINAFLGQDILPVGNLPTTAMLTRIRHHSKPVIQHYDQDGRHTLSQPLTADVWDELVADNFTGNDPRGTVLVGIDNAWLKNTNIELMDTPGAGDLEAERAQIIGDTLLRADAAIITVSALQALSMSEKLFIEQRLIARKTPFLMLILTKLDQVPLDDRLGVIEYVQQKLQHWKMDIPVFLPYEVELDDDSYRHMMGMDKIKAHILSWRTDPERAALTERWLVDKIINALTTASEALLEQKKLMDGAEEERQEKIRQKREMLSRAKLAWGNLQIQMLSRCTKCQEELARKAQESADSITERLQYEAAMSGSPQKWWNESYPYRLKIELSNLSNSLDTMANRIMAEDAKWINAAMEKQFKTHVLVEKEHISDKSMFGDMNSDHTVAFKDIEKQRNLARVGTAALTVACAMICAGTGTYPLIATMGIGTGSSILTEKVFKQEIEKQRQDIKAAIGKNVPKLIDTSMSESDKRIRAVYNDMLREAEKQEALWMEAQQSSMDAALAAPDGKLEQVAKQLEEINALTEDLLTLK